MAPHELELNCSSLAYVETVYLRFLEDPASVEPQWRQYFQAAAGAEAPASFSVPHDRFEMTSASPKDLRTIHSSRFDAAALQHRVDKLVRNFRVRGHIAAHLDPLGKTHPDPPELDPAYFGITPEMMDEPIFSERGRENEPLSVRAIYERMRNTYCRYIGVQFMHIDDLATREWLQARMEKTENRLALERREQLRILRRLTDAVIFEEFIQKKYIGAKSFSLEGGETLIPLLDYAIECAGEHGVEEILIGMPHRGRLNVLANIMGKHPHLIFKEFEDDRPEEYLGRGDVKYHLGYHTNWWTDAGKKVHLSLTFNPSHLEYVNPGVLGRLRARHDHEGDPAGERAMALLIHGDAAFMGEGVVQETLNLSELPGYRTGGALHIVVNNQIGFTATPDDGRSTLYATDVARMLQSPVFHVNGEDPEAVAAVVKLALDYRREFHRDVFIDMYCYRLRGHNEGDEPAFTQPLLYKQIRQRMNTRDSYLEQLLKLGGVTREEAGKLAENRQQALEAELSEARGAAPKPTDGAPDHAWRDSVHHDRGRPENRLREAWKPYYGGPYFEAGEAETALGEDDVKSRLGDLCRIPDGFSPHPKILRILHQREAMARGKRPLDWAAAEQLAFASLLAEGRPIRISGQDSQRGTFSHRHAVLHDCENGAIHCPLKHLGPSQARFDIYNSPLSEAGVLGFEYGYSVGTPEGLTIWEAQFGDFSNCAQVIIDQFIATAEDKWKRLTGLTMLLPHGLEGTGPEHASARLERFLMMTAEDNIQVCQPTTPAQYFHLLRRQVLRRLRKPLIVMSPKSMLRHPRNISPMEEFTAGRFRPILPDEPGERKGVKRVLLCSGKIYYDLFTERELRDRNDVAILRFEQLYPLSEAQILDALEPYGDAEIAWIQEESMNMGAWPHLRFLHGDRLAGRWPLRCIARPASASPATGSHASHKLEQKMLMEQAFD